MKLCYRDLVCIAVIVGGLVLTACSDPADEVSRAKTPVSPPPGKSPAGKPAETASPGAVDKPVPAPPKVTAEQPEETQPLDLSLPPQPKVELGSLEGKRMPARRLLPDLFKREEPSNTRALSLKGRVLTNETGREELDAIQGGEITMEMKTR